MHQRLSASLCSATLGHPNEHETGDPVNASPPAAQDQCQHAYDQTMRPFHGWVSRRGFAAAQRGMPDWADVRA
eukprot:393201-Prymnesium_polylepis.1